MVSEQDECESVPDSQKYLLMFMSNKNDASSLQLLATPSSNNPTSVQTETSGGIIGTFNIAPSMASPMIIPSDYIQIGIQVEDKGIMVTSDRGINLFGFTDDADSCGAFAVFKTSNLGNEYFSVSFWPNTGAGMTEFGVAAQYPNTYVYITFRANTGLNVVYNGVPFYSGSTMVVPMSELQTIQIQSRTDLSGTHILSNNPIAVFSGNDWTGVNTDNSGARGHLIEQMPPIETLGKEYYVVALPDRERNVIRVVATQANTNVATNVGRYQFLPDIGSVWDINTAPESLKITADKKILVTQFAKSAGYSAVPETSQGPAMVVLPSSETYESDYMFVTKGSNADSYVHHVMIVVNNTYIDGLQLNGVQVNRVLFSLLLYGRSMHKMYLI